MNGLHKYEKYARTSLHSSPSARGVINDIKAVGIVQKKDQTTSKGKRQMISSRQVAKLMKRGETVFLAMIRPTMNVKQGITQKVNQHEQGMTQKVKQEQMKTKGPMRKAITINFTCNDAVLSLLQ